MWANARTCPVHAVLGAFRKAILNLNLTLHISVHISVGGGQELWGTKTKTFQPLFDNRLDIIINNHTHMSYTIQ